MKERAHPRGKCDGPGPLRRLSFRNSRIILFLAPGTIGVSTLLFAGSAQAQALAFLTDLAQDLEAFSIAMSGGLALFSAVVAIEHIRQRAAWSRREAELTIELELYAHEA